MIDIILSLVCGIIIGRILPLKESHKTLIQKGYTAVIFLLILFMGLQIGMNKSIIENLSTIGVHAALFAVVTISGSVLAVMAIERARVMS
ncbi:MAG: LysO family transporter [Theionarchaea archaeon]|nr:LysO family transporter [Theionarchaea archaeon]MBU7038775.1 LysO family transporter [Theionarchaea archaeon]